MSTQFKNLEWDITSFIKESGNYQVRFQYTGGSHRLDIQWAELLINGKPISRDAHAGRTGGENVNNVYFLKLENFKSGTKVILRASVLSDGGTDSSGNITIEKS